MKNPTITEIRALLDLNGKLGLQMQMQGFSPEAQDRCYRVFEQVENQKLEQIKLEIQKDANRIASISKKLSGCALLVSIIACLFAALSFWLTYIRG